jgi:hypothetical protein
VRRDKVCSIVAELVQLDDDKAGGEGAERERVQRGVDVGSGALLRGGVGWLQDQDGLGQEEEGARVEKLGGGRRLVYGEVERGTGLKSEERSEREWKLGRRERTGCAENSMRGESKMLPQTMTKRIHIPAWARGAVPWAGLVGRSRGNRISRRVTYLSKDSTRCAGRAVVLHLRAGRGAARPRGRELPTWLICELCTAEEVWKWSRWRDDSRRDGCFVALYVYGSARCEGL